MMSPVKEAPQINDSEGRREEGQSDERNEKKQKTTERMERREGGEGKRNKGGRKEWRG